MIAFSSIALAYGWYARVYRIPVPLSPRRNGGSTSTEGAFRIRRCGVPRRIGADRLSRRRFAHLHVQRGRALSWHRECFGYGTREGAVRLSDPSAEFLA